MEIHSSVLTWRIPMDRGAWWAIVHGVTGSDMTEQRNPHTHTSLGSMFVFFVYKSISVFKISSFVSFF